MEFRDILINHRLFIDESLEGFIRKFSATKNHDRNKKVLATWKEGYLYSLALGILIDRREPFIKRGEKARTWAASINLISQYQSLFSKVLHKKEVLNEIGILSSDLSETPKNKLQKITNNFLDADGTFSEEKIISTFNKVKNICDEYANGGVTFLNEWWNSDNSILGSYDSLVTIFEEIKEEIDSTGEFDSYKYKEIS